MWSMEQGESNESLIAGCSFYFKWADNLEAICYDTEVIIRLN